MNDKKTDQLTIYDTRGRKVSIRRDKPPLPHSEDQRSIRCSAEEFDKIRQYTMASLNLLPKNKSNSFGSNAVSTTDYKQSEVRDIVKNFKTEANQVKIVEVSQQLYAVSTQYKRLVNHFSGMPLYSTVIAPTKDLKSFTNGKTKNDAIKKQYREIGELLKKMDLSDTFRKQHKRALVEDVVFGWVHETDESFFIQNFDFKISKISSIEDGVFNFALDMSSFESDETKLEFMPKEVNNLYKKWKRQKKKDSQISEWVELPSEKTFCLKVSDEMLETFPFFAGVFDSIYDVDAFKQLRKDSAELANYMAIVQKLPIREGSNDNNDFLLDAQMYQYFTQMAQTMVPDQVGVFTTPMEIDTVKFDGKKAGDDGVEKATKDVWNDSGISSVLFNTEASSTTQGLNSSIKTDEELVFDTLSQMARWLNRYLKFKYKKKLIFGINILDVTVFNQKEKYDMYLSAGQYGIPVKSHIASTVGLQPIELMSMAYLENDVLAMHEEFIPLQSSHTMSGKEDGSAVKSTKNESDANDTNGGREKLPDNERSSETERNDTKPSATSKA